MYKKFLWVLALLLLLLSSAYAQDKVDYVNTYLMCARHRNRTIDEDNTTVGGCIDALYKPEVRYPLWPIQSSCFALGKDYMVIPSANRGITLLYKEPRSKYGGIGAADICFELDNYDAIARLITNLHCAAGWNELKRYLLYIMDTNEVLFIDWTALTLSDD